MEEGDQIQIFSKGHSLLYVDVRLLDYLSLLALYYVIGYIIVTIDDVAIAAEKLFNSLSTRLLIVARGNLVLQLVIAIAAVMVAGDVVDCIVQLGCSTARQEALVPRSETEVIKIH